MGELIEGNECCGEELPEVAAEPVGAWAGRRTARSFRREWESRPESADEHAPRRGRCLLWILVGARWPFPVDEIPSLMADVAHLTDLATSIVTTELRDCFAELAAEDLART